MQFLVRPIIIAADLCIDADRSTFVLDDRFGRKLSFEILVDTSTCLYLFSLVMAEESPVERLVEPALAQATCDIRDRLISPICHPLDCAHDNDVIQGQIICKRTPVRGEKSQQRVADREPCLDVGRRRRFRELRNAT